MDMVQSAGAKSAALGAPAPAGVARAFVRRSPRSRRSEERTKTARVAVVLSIFLALLAMALLLGGRAVIDPLLQAAAKQRESHRVGDIVFTMRDPRLCRHLSFDNRTAELIEGGVERCAHDQPADRSVAAKGFTWGAPTPAH
jgi:hypothetical protein